MALLAIIMSVNFTACSSDDDPVNGNENSGSEKKLTKIHLSKDMVIITYTYDEKNRLIKSIRTGKNYTWETKFTWGTDIIIAESDSRNQTYYLENNLIVDYNNWETFQYNSSKQIIATEEGGIKRNFTWNNNKLIEEQEYSDILTFNYKGQTCKGFFPLMPMLAFDFSETRIYELYFAHPNLVGLQTQQLPCDLTYFSSNTERKYTFEYTFTKDGYVESCTMKEGNYVNVITFEWE